MLPKHRDFILNLIGPKLINYKSYRKISKELANDPYIQKLADSTPVDRKDPLTPINFMLELPFKTSFLDFSGREHHANFDRDLTIVTSYTTAFPFRPVASPFLSDMEGLEEFIRHHNLRHTLATINTASYVLTLTGELLYLEGGMLPSFSGVHDLFDKTPFPGQHVGFLGMTPITTEEFFVFKDAFSVLPTILPIPINDL